MAKKTKGQPAKNETPAAKKQYFSHRERMARTQSDQSKSARDIDGAESPWIFETKNPKRRKRCRKSLRKFCEEYFPDTFSLGWSDDHLKVIAKIERAVLHGELFAIAMPRGSGKTSICEVACIWAMLYGYHQFVVLLGADELHAINMLDSIKSHMENNDLLHEDFSEVTGPIRAMEGIHQRANGQLYKGERTQIGWRNDEIILPTIEGSIASGAIVRVAGILGRVRGMKYVRSDGKTVRPTLVLPDDPQTDESARSPSQCNTRLRIITGAVLGLAGPGKKIAGLMPVTVIEKGDMADQVLDRHKHPEWQGERLKMLHRMPTSKKLWEEYAILRKEGMRLEQGTAAATDFYRTNRKAMDEGAMVSWEARKNEDDLSGIQHAMNLMIDRGERAFWAEFQNEPLAEDVGAEDLTAGDVLKKVVTLSAGMVPTWATHLTAFIDVQDNLLFGGVCAWSDKFRGHLARWGSFPDQGRGYFTYGDAHRSIAREFPGLTKEAGIRAALDAYAEQLLGRSWKREDGAEMRVSQCLVDAGDGDHSDIVYEFCRRSKFAAVLLPSKGRGVGASSLPWEMFGKRDGQRLGHHWLIAPLPKQTSVRLVQFDTNYWKTFLQARLRAGVGDSAGLELHAGDQQMIADHVTSEAGIKVEAVGRNRTVTEWKRRPNRENHGLDVMVGNLVAASILGVKDEHSEMQTTERRRIKLSEIQKQKRGA